jgi:hypothetical protein
VLYTAVFIWFAIATPAGLAISLFPGTVLLKIG